ncbi:MAG: NERD domain-containing protein, partial [Cryobacterium sp.]|nr:NERD domain-containing protein [Cryobacterium sp.]
MAAGHSANSEAAKYKAQAEQAEYIAKTARQMGRNYIAAAASEKWLADTLKPLAERGYTILADRKWPNSTTAQVDFVLVGPSGIYIVDAKSWSDVTIESG